MSKRKDLRSKLKASDRRRRRRQTSAGDSAIASGGVAIAAGTKPEVDVTGVVVREILSVRGINDGSVTVTLRAIVRGAPPTGEVASKLYASISQVAARHQFSRRQVLDAAEQLLGMASPHQAGDDFSFVNYLRVIVG